MFNLPIRAALNGELINSLIVDEETATTILESIGKVRHVA